MSEHYLPPIARIYDLASLSNAGDELVIEASIEERKAIAHWADIAGLESFRARVTLTRRSQNRFMYEAVLDADVVQTCVVSLEPVPSHIARQVKRELHVVHGLRRDQVTAELSLAAGDDDVPEDIDSPRYDLAAPLLEEFSLSLDPYPRASGVTFDSPDGDDKPPSPFAVLAKLKKG